MTMTLTVKTNQEAFDTVARHLSTMSQRAMEHGEVCAYRAADGSKCAVGALIVEWDTNAPNHEGVWGLVEMSYPSENSWLDIGDVSVDLLKDLQRAHDSVENWGSAGFIAHDSLRVVALQHDLSYAILPTLFFESSIS